MKISLLPFALTMLSVAVLSQPSVAQSPVALGSAAKFGILAGGAAKTTTPAYSYGQYGGLLSTSPNISGTSGSPASAQIVQTALNDLSNAKTQAYSLQGLVIQPDLTGLSLGAGVYRVSGNAFVQPKGIVRWSGNTGENWVLISQPHGKIPSYETAAL